jgi:tungstate transport system substrate-binding protein
MKPVYLMMVVSLTVAGGCDRPEAPTRALILATTTSTQDSGLLDVLVPVFRQQTGIEVKVVAVGSGQALQLGRRGDADVILAHSPEAEERFMAEGQGESRRAVMYNDFVLVGPAADPAGARGKTSIAEVLAAVARSRSPFVSRGDDSGTHQKEKQVWKAAGVDPGGDWYIEAGAGMAQVLRTADQKRAYTLSDRATFLAHKGLVALAVLAEGDLLLKNDYHVIVVSPRTHPGVHAQSAMRFSEFLLNPETQRVISEFGTEKYGQALFTAEAGKGHGP